MHESRTRSAVKSISWRIICIIVSIITSYILTNEWNIAIAIGITYNATNIVLYYVHERVWTKITWGLKHTKH
jgi:uncharacterized membrane protein